jgi:hypothetical protein
VSNSGSGGASVDGQTADVAQGLGAVNAVPSAEGNDTTEPRAEEMDEGRDETTMADEEDQMEDDF